MILGPGFGSTAHFMPGTALCGPYRVAGFRRLRAATAADIYLQFTILHTVFAVVFSDGFAPPCRRAGLQWTFPERRAVLQRTRGTVRLFLRTDYAASQLISRRQPACCGYRRITPDSTWFYRTVAQLSPLPLNRRTPAACCACLPAAFCSLPYACVVYLHLQGFITPSLRSSLTFPAPCFTLSCSRHLVHFNNFLYASVLLRMVLRAVFTAVWYVELCVTCARWFACNMLRTGYGCCLRFGFILTFAERRACCGSCVPVAFGPGRRCILRHSLFPSPSITT